MWTHSPGGQLLCPHCTPIQYHLMWMTLHGDKWKEGGKHVWSYATSILALWQYCTPLCKSQYWLVGVHVGVMYTLWILQNVYNWLLMDGWGGSSFSPAETASVEYIFILNILFCDFSQYFLLSSRNGFYSFCVCLTFFSFFFFANS